MESITKYFFLVIRRPATLVPEGDPCLPESALNYRGRVRARDQRLRGAGHGPEDLKAFVDSDIELWTSVVRARNIHAD